MALLTLFQKAAAQSRCTIEATSIIEEDDSAGANDHDCVRAAVGGRGCNNGHGHIIFSRERNYLILINSQIQLLNTPVHVHFVHVAVLHGLSLCSYM